jgi:CheY-like chemotaxis protein
MSTTVIERPIEVLLMEDDRTDVQLTRRGFTQSKLNVHLNVVPDGAEGMAFLRREGPYSGAPVPDLIVLDLNMPKKNGREVLEELKESSQLKHIPVIVLSTSSEPRDILQAYQLHANCYITKPTDFEEFLHAVRSVEEFWMALAQIPTMKGA